jgi:polar amino acid transport system substrate-binding protein
MNAFVNRRLAILSFLTIVLCSSASAQDRLPNPVRAAVTVVPPYVIEENGALTGFNIELWNLITAKLDLKTTYENLPDVETLEAALRQNKADVIVYPKALTLTRIRDFDVSVPILQLGLQILVVDTGEMPRREWRLLRELSILFSPTAFLWLGIALLLVLVPAHLVWLLERNSSDGIITSSSYFPGIFQAIYWALAVLATQAEKMPLDWLARIVAVFWMFTGVAFVASYTAQLTSRLTLQQIRTGIRGPEDLPGKYVGTIVDTYAGEYLEEHNVHVRTFEKPEQLFQALLDRKVDAVVWEAPILHYFADHGGRGRVMLVGPEFAHEPLSFLFPLRSPLRRQVDIVLVGLRDDGTYKKLHKKWFGDL